MISKFLFSLLFACLAFFLATPSMSGETIRVVGSDFAGAVLKFSTDREDSLGSDKVSYQMTGSYIGLLKLRDNFADVAFVLQTSDGHPGIEELTTIPIGFWGIYFAVEESNPLNEVGVDVLTEVFRKTRGGLKSEWGTLLPDSPKWGNRLVFVTFDVESSDPSFPVLLNQFFDNEVPHNFSSMGERIENPYLAGASNLLVMARMPRPGKGLRALSLVQSGQSVGFPPSAESMFFGDYPLRMSLSIVVRDPKDSKVRAFIRDLFATNWLKLLEDSGLVFVPKNVQLQALLEFDLNF